VEGAARIIPALDTPFVQSEPACSCWTAEETRFPWLDRSGLGDEEAAIPAARKGLETALGFCFEQSVRFRRPSGRGASSEVGIIHQPI
jgi:hypothetical protein